MDLDHAAKISTCDTANNVKILTTLVSEETIAMLKDTIKITCINKHAIWKTNVIEFKSPKRNRQPREETPEAQKRSENSFLKVRKTANY